METKQFGEWTITVYELNFCQWRWIATRGNEYRTGLLHAADADEVFEAVTDVIGG